MAQNKNVKVENNEEVKEIKEVTQATESEVSTGTEVATATGPETEKLTTKIWAKVKKPLAIAGGVAAGAVALFAAAKIGEATGFDKACDSFDQLSGSDPETDDNEDLVDISDEVEAIEL